jgi:fumarate reductase flavoprotein subunit
MSTADRHDCVIVGGGLAGIAAACRLIELGIRPTLVERGAEDGGAGNARISGGLLHVAWEALDTPADVLYARLLEETDGEIDPALARRFADGAGRALEWLRSHDIELAPKGDLPYMRHALAPHGEGIGRRIQPERGTDRTLVTLYEGVRRGGGDVRLGVSAERLAPARDGGWIVSCRADGAAHELHARAVLVADGGFQGSPDLLTRYVGPNAATALLRAMPTSTGAGLRMLLGVGAQGVGLGRVYGHVVSRSAFENDTLWPYPTLDKLCLQALLVDRRGERFATHAGDGVALVNELVRTETPRAFRLIFDEALWNGAGADNPYGAPVPNPDLVERGGDHHVAETLEGLAEAVGIDAQTLRAAVEAHNADPAKVTIAAPPFRAIAIVPGITFTQGGVKVDPDCAVLDALDQPIAGLYAAGSCTGGLHGGPRGGYVGGLADALVFGLAAADAIAVTVGAVASEAPA